MAFRPPSPRRPLLAGAELDCVHPDPKSTVEGPRLRPPSSCFLVLYFYLCYFGVLFSFFGDKVLKTDFYYIDEAGLDIKKI